MGCVQVSLGYVQINVEHIHVKTECTMGSFERSQGSVITCRRSGKLEEAHAIVGC